MYFLSCAVIFGDEAFCQEEVITEDLEVNRYVPPIRHTHLESELTIGSGNSVVIGDYFHGGSHIGYKRMKFRWGHVGTFHAAPGGHKWQIMTEHDKVPQPGQVTNAVRAPDTWPLPSPGRFHSAGGPRG